MSQNNKYKCFCGSKAEAEFKVASSGSADWGTHYYLYRIACECGLSGEWAVSHRPAVLKWERLQDALARGDYERNNLEDKK